MMVLMSLPCYWDLQCWSDVAKALATSSMTGMEGWKPEALCRVCQLGHDLVNGMHIFRVHTETQMHDRTRSHMGG